LGGWSPQGVAEYSSAARFMPSHDALLHVTNLTKRYGRVVALRDASFTVRRGEILGLIGPNGSGKTTLFECLGGVLPFDRGTIDGNGRLAPTTLFYLPDGITPWPAESVEWTQQFVLGFFGGPVSLQSEVNERLDLNALLTSPMRTLSKGQRKRALLALGLLTPHPALLADEPFDGLDLRQIREAAALFREVASRGRTLFLSIHQIPDAARVCDRFLLLSDGRVRGEGTLPDLRQHAGCSDESSLEDVFLALT
jgi:ABC-2 type transport system ATP-binding protein